MIGECLEKKTYQTWHKKLSFDITFVFFAQFCPKKNKACHVFKLKKNSTYDFEKKSESKTFSFNSCD